MVAPGALRVNLPDSYRKFVICVSRGMTNEAASSEAGFSPSTGSQLVRRPEIMAAIHQEVARLIRVEGAPVAFKVLLDIAKDVTAPKGVRVDAAKTLLSRAGHVEPRAEQAKPDEVPMNEMTQDQLHSLVNQLEGELAARAKPIGAPLPTDDVDIFE